MFPKSVIIDGIEYAPKETYLTVTDVFENYIGTKEYEGVVKVIQEWFYGKFVKDAWCATSMCWALAQLGLREYTLKGKSDNVYDLYLRCLNALDRGAITRIHPSDVKKGDIIFLCWSEIFNTTATKHVTSFYNKESDEIFECLGGNQGDKIQVSKYNVKYIKDIFRPHYEKGTLKSINNLPNVSRETF